MEGIGGDVRGTVLRAVLTIGLSSVPGFCAGYFQIFTQDTLQRLSRFQINFLMPCLITSNLGARLSFERLARFWPLLCWSCIQLMAGFCVTRLLVRAHSSWSWAKPGKDNLVPLLLIGVAFQNVSVFNLPLLESLCSVQGLFPEHCYDDGTLMIFTYAFPWDLSLWTFGYSAVFALGNKQHHKSDVVPSETISAEVDAKCGNPTSQMHSLLGRILGFVCVSSREAVPRNFTARLRSCTDSILGGLNPVLTAIALGIVIGLTPPLQALLFGTASPLQFVGDALKRIGAPVPLIGLTILSGTLGGALRRFKDVLQEHLKRPHSSLENKDPEADSAGGNELQLLSRSQVSWGMAVLAGKLVCMPVLCFMMIAVLRSIQSVSDPVRGGAGEALATVSEWSAMELLANGLWPRDDRLLHAMVVMQWSAPSCLTLIVLCHRVGLSESIVQVVAASYIAMYLLGIISTTLWMSAGLAIV